MLGFVIRQLRYRRGRVATLAAGILVAAASFVLLTSAAQTSELHVKGTVAKNFRAAYDILVRPKSSFTQLEKQRGLIKANYLSGIFGGITMHQYRTVKKIPGVEVAAPIANIGYELPFQNFYIPINDVLNSQPHQLYRIDGVWTANQDSSHYPTQYTHYVYYTPTYDFTLPHGFSGISEQLPGGRSLPICGAVSASAPSIAGPFTHTATIECFSKKASQSAPNAAQYANFDHPLPPSGFVGLLETASFPMLVTAIDPVAEAKLVHLDHAIVDGRYLRSADQAKVVKKAGSLDVPAIVSSHSFVADKLVVSIQRLRLSSHGDVPRALSSGTCSVGIYPCPAGRYVEPPKNATYKTAYDFVSHLRGPVLGRRTFRLGPVYKKMTALGKEVFSDLYWSTSDVRYHPTPDGRLAPLAQRNPKTVWNAPRYGSYPAPPDNRDVQFRRLHPHAGSNQSAGNIYETPSLKVVGHFDPSKLPGFSPLSQVPLETYYPPAVRPAGGQSKRVLHSHPLLPTQNIGGYVAQPPLMLTTLKGMQAFLSRRHYPDLKRKEIHAPLSVIRVRVAGVTGASPLSRERIKGVAAAIHRKTGLAVDITAGSSPHPMLIDLPQGKFGQPPLTVKEGWVEKGVAVRFLDAVDKKSLFLFSLVLVVCALFLANAALASVRARRTEIGTLQCLGWSRTSIFRAIVAELALVGALAGIAGTVLALIAVPLLSLHISLLRALLVAPVAVVVAIIAGLLPAWRAARGRPMDALSPPVIGGDHRRHVSHILGMALANTARIPARTLVAITGLVFGVGALTVLIALNRALQGTLVGTLMGHFISSQIRGVDFLSVLLVIALGGLAVADILFLNLSERSAELVTLRTVGWRDQHLRALIGLEGIATGALGCAIGAALGIGVAALIRGVPIATIALAAAVAAAAGLVVTVVAALLPLIRITALTPPTVLAEE
jgi:putative ABC transport system permease protein